MRIKQRGGSSIAVLSWRDIQSAARGIHAAIVNSAVNVEVVVGISRGGMVPAVMLSHMLRVSILHCIRIRTTTTDDVRAQRSVPTVASTTIEDAGDLAKQMLLVDDVVNTGATFRAAREYLVGRGSSKLLSAALVWDMVDAPGEVGVEFVPLTVNAWVEFPWE